MKCDITALGWLSGALKESRALVVALAMAASLAGCSPLLSTTDLSQGQRQVASNEVVMGISSFLQPKVTISAGESVTFVDPADSGGIHFICVGAHQLCKSTPGTPAPLATAHGLQFTNGQAPVNITFATPGVYHVICTIHPGMEVEIVVK